MKVTLVMLSGIAGGMRLAIDAERLPPQDAAELARLVSAAKAEQPAEREGQIREKIQIEDAAGTVDLEQPITGMSPAFSALRSWMNDHSQQGTRGRE